MTIKFDNVYLKDVSTVACLDEKKGTFGKLYDKTYDNYYIDCDTFEKAEIKMIHDSIDILTKKSNTSLDNIDVILGADLLNQIVASSYASVLLNRPFLGLYNACASLCEEYIVGASLLQNSNINNIITCVSSHNMTAERQFRNPVEYGCPKPKRSTFTVTAAASSILTKEKTNIKLSSAGIGTTCDLKVDDVYDMGSVMAPAAAKTLYEYLTDTNTKVEDYDLILTGDLGVYGKEILKKYMEESYSITLGENYNDAGSIVYDRNIQTNVKAGGSGPACVALALYTDVIEKMKSGILKKVLVLATGALMSPTMNNQKFTIPSICHAICLEAIK